jgi:hypothetical protein
MKHLTVQFSPPDIYFLSNFRKIVDIFKILTIQS